MKTIVCFGDSSSSPDDGIHFDSGEHFKLGQAIAAKVKAIFE